MSSEDQNLSPKLKSAVAEARKGMAALREEPLPANLQYRIRATLSEKSSPRRVPAFALAFAATAALVGGGWLAWQLLDAKTKNATTVADNAGGSSVFTSSPALAGWSLGPSCSPTQIEGVLDVAEGCDLHNEDDGLRMQAIRSASFREEDGGLRVVRGRVEVKATKSAQVRRVFVSHGVIEIVGTEFTVNQEEESGSVDLREGAIRFVAANGQTVLLAPGESLNWPLDEGSGMDEPQENEPSETERPRPRRKRVIAAKPTKAQINELLIGVSKLRARRKYNDAIKLLHLAIEDVQTVRAADQLSFELGSILTYQLQDKKRGCPHWSRHARRYPRTAYGEAIERARSKLGCAEP